MLMAAFAALGVAVLLGAGLAVQHMRTARIPATPWPAAALHMALGLGGLGGLGLALRGPPRGLEQGTASFGTVSAALIAAAALIGAMMLAQRLRKRRPAAGLIGLHATFAIGGFVILMAYVLAG
jgi:hypothetical protein